MNRRKSLQALSLSIPILTGCASSKVASQRISTPDQVFQLKKGDTIGLVSPGSSLSDEAKKKCVENIEILGFKVKEGKYWKGQYGYLSGTDEQRLYDIHAMFEDDEVDAIWCARGGYGCTRLLPLIDYDIIKKYPKPFIGYSDITALHNAFYLKAGLIGFHGPVASSDFTNFTKSSVMSMLNGDSATHLLSCHNEHNIEVIIPGEATGTLLGGNLSVLAAMCGTPYEVNFENSVAFLEDVGEKPYRVDRMLTQLLQSSHLGKANGIILGIWKGCKADEGERSLTLRQCFIDRLGDLGIPVALGYSFGHISEQFTLPVGGYVTFATADNSLQVER